MEAEACGHVSIGAATQRSLTQQILCNVTLQEVNQAAAELLRHVSATRAPSIAASRQDSDGMKFPATIVACSPPETNLTSEKVIIELFIKY